METQESEKLHGNAQDTNKQNSNYEMVETVEIEDTPFTAVRVEEDWFLTLGKYRLTEKLPSKEEVIESALRTDWNRLMQIMHIMITERENEKNNLKTV